VAIASDSPAATTLANADKTPPWLALHDAAAIAAFVLAHARQS